MIASVGRDAATATSKSLRPVIEKEREEPVETSDEPRTSELLRAHFDRVTHSWRLRDGARAAFAASVGCAAATATSEDARLISGRRERALGETLRAHLDRDRTRSTEDSSAL